MATIRLCWSAGVTGVSAPGHTGPRFDGEPVGDRMTARGDKVSLGAERATLPHRQGNDRNADHSRIGTGPQY